MTDIGMIDSYKKQGINIVPIPKGSGKALNISGGWKKYQYEMYTDKIPEDQDIAVILGGVSGNLIVLDFDECEDITEVEAIKKGVLNFTLVVRTGDGYHMYAKVDKLPTKANTFLTKGRFKMEVKGEGAYVVGATSNHYDKDEEGKYVLTGKKYNVVSNTTTIGTIHASGDAIIEKLVKDCGWITNLNLPGANDDSIITSTAELAKGNWQYGERYNNGFKLALRRFHMRWKYEEILNEALIINNGCNPPHTPAEVERWVMDAHTQYEKNMNNPEQQYFQPYDAEKAAGVTKQDKEKDKIDNTAILIQRDRHFRCLRDSDELFMYNGKIYETGLANSVISEETEKAIENCTTHDASEVVNKIKRTNYIERDELDMNPMIQVVDNGVLNMETLELKEHTPLYLSCVMLPVAYIQPVITEITIETVKEYLKGTLFLKYLESSFTIDGKFDSRQFMTVLEIMASTLLKRQLDKAFMFIGKGANGKSIMLDYIEAMLGEKNVSSESIHDLEEDKFKKAELFGKMANIYADIDSYELKKTGNLKLLISGDSISAQKKHSHPFKFKPYAKLLFSANRFPYVHDQSDGFFRRWIIVEWNRQFEITPENANLRKDLIADKQEMSKVFSLLTVMAKDLNETGKFRHAMSISDLRTQWNRHSDPIMQFIDARIIEVEGRSVPKIEMYKAYKDWCYENEIHPLTIKKFGMIFSEYYEDTQQRDQDDKGINRKVWIDVQIKLPEQIELEEFDKENE